MIYIYVHFNIDISYLASYMFIYDLLKAVLNKKNINEVAQEVNDATERLAYDYEFDATKTLSLEQ